MAVTVAPKLAAYYDVTFIMCGMVFCHRCQAEAVYTSSHPAYTDENYYDLAIAMQAEGWRVVPKSLDAFCPTCAAQLGLPLTGEEE